MPGSRWSNACVHRSAKLKGLRLFLDVVLVAGVTPGRDPLSQPASDLRSSRVQLHFFFFMGLIAQYLHSNYTVICKSLLAASLNLIAGS